ncbi:hypothetical protein Dsin_013999 [Dipteronia sinensis]|uniref:Acid phosphatase n=1 Tax=Dipteronia sinensis TaxID=43782 RepID=A0AAE0E9M4_9ROSI|nr:hypothetical protein Dsin_013999 [Dipteronia sinensis]
MKLLVLPLFFLLVSTTASASRSSFLNPIHLLRQEYSSSEDHNNVANTTLDCVSWRLAVETNNIRNWEVIPDECQTYIGHYMLGHQYPSDCEYVAGLAYDYAKGVELVGDGKDAWVLDLDDTALSNAPYYYVDNSYWAKDYNKTEFVEWELKGEAPAVPGILDLYNKLLELEFKIVFITGKDETTLRNITEYNLKNVGYHNWEKLLLRDSTEASLTKLEYKSKKRALVVADGYRIWGNMGDQWSDLLGENPGNRTFKVPMPMFYLK